MSSNTAHQQLQLQTALDPDAYASGAATTTGAPEIDTRGFTECAFIVMAGDLGSSGTVDVQIQESATSGSGYTDITGAAITQLTQAGSDDNKHVVIRLDLRKRLRYLITEFTIGTAASDLAIACVLAGGNEFPVSTTDADEVVSG